MGGDAVPADVHLGGRGQQLLRRRSGGRGCVSAPSAPNQDGGQRQRRERLHVLSAFLMRGRGANWPFSTARLSTPSHWSSNVAYTRRKSMAYFRSPASRSSSFGWSPTGPPVTAGPATNKHDPA